MAKGTKRKIAIEKITKKESRATCCTKRLQGLSSKASQLCLLSGAQIAVLATPPSSNSNVSFYSFGHSSVDAIVAAFLAGRRPLPVPEGYDRETKEDVGICLARKDLGLHLWWEDENLARSENPEELGDAIESISKLMSDFKELRQRKNHHQVFVHDEDLKKKNQVKINDVVVLEHVTQEPLNQTLNLQSSSAICCTPDDDLPAKFNNKTEVCDTNMCSDHSQATEYGNLVGQSALDEDDLRFSDLFNELPSTEAL